MRAIAVGGRSPARTSGEGQHDKRQGQSRPRDSRRSRLCYHAAVSVLRQVRGRMVLDVMSGKRHDRDKGFAGGPKRASLNHLQRGRGAPVRPERLFTLSRVEERRLVADARSGDPRALARLLELLSGPIYRFGRSFCGDRHDAEDVTQVALMALARALKDFRGDASLTTWAYTVARNECTRQRRPRAGAPRHLESLDAGGPATGAAIEVADPGQDPHRALERAELGRALDRAIAALPPGQREVLLLRDVEGLAAGDVGRALGLSERAVKSRLHRARVALRISLAPWADSSGRASQPAAAGRCPDTVRLVSRYLEGELDPEACSKLRAHVDQCAPCSAACETLRRALVACQAWRGARLPAALRASMRRALSDEVVVTRAKS